MLLHYPVLVLGVNNVRNESRLGHLHSTERDMHSTPWNDGATLRLQGPASIVSRRSSSVSNAVLCTGVLYGVRRLHVLRHFLGVLRTVDRTRETSTDATMAEEHAAET